MTDAAISRPPLDYPAVPVDGLLGRAARRWPDRVAISAESGKVTFAELDRAADRCGATVAGLTDGPGCRVAIATELSPAFAAAFYGVVRVGRAAVTLNPLHRPEATARTIAASGARLVLATDRMLEQLAPMAGQLPDLLPLASISAPDLVFPADLAAPAPGAPARPGDVACVHHTSGTTGDPKGVLLTHRNLVVNAAQVTQAHSLDSGAVCFNALPAYHLMHLNAAVYAGATQVLYGAPALTGSDPVARSLAAADHAGATHYYTLPVLLARLARESELTRPATLRGIFCGGSALSPAAARALTERLGVPVVQGYGLAETSSMTHLEPPGRPRPWSVGTPVADTECRIVDTETRTPLPTGLAGEVEVRGPQLMAGYSGGLACLTSDGWLPTGDVGRCDPDGYLFLVDRLKDVFKCDNELVSPTELELVLESHPAVRDCAVVDQPDPARGAVPVALLVLDPAAADPADVVDYANKQLATFQHIARAHVVRAIPRSPIGKIARRDLRRTVLTGIAGP